MWLYSSACFGFSLLLVIMMYANSNNFPPTFLLAFFSVGGCLVRFQNFAHRLLSENIHMNFSEYCLFFSSSSFLLLERVIFIFNRHLLRWRWMNDWNLMVNLHWRNSISFRSADITGNSMRCHPIRNPRIEFRFTKCGHSHNSISCINSDFTESDEEGKQTALGSQWACVCEKSRRQSVWEREWASVCMLLMEKAL